MLNIHSYLKNHTKSNSLITSLALNPGLDQLVSRPKTDHRAQASQISELSTWIFCFNNFPDFWSNRNLTQDFWPSFFHSKNGPTPVMVFSKNLSDPMSWTQQLVLPPRHNRWDDLNTGICSLLTWPKGILLSHTDTFYRFMVSLQDNMTNIQHLRNIHNHFVWWFELQAFMKNPWDY